MRIPTMAGALVLALAAHVSAQPVADTAESAAVGAVAPAPDDARLLAWSPGGTSIVLSLMLRERIEAVGGFEVDRYGSRFEPDPVADGTVRLGAHFDSRMAWAPIGLGVDYEHDLVTGVQTGSTEDADLAANLPNDGSTGHELRQASLRLSFGRYMHLTGGVMTSHWGLGLVANDGAHGWAPGNASFSDPRSGDRVLRGALVLGPFCDQNLALIVAADRVGAFNDLSDPGVFTGDDALFDGDEAQQVVASLVWGFRQPTWAGVYAVVREQEAASGDVTRVVVVDAAGAMERELPDASTLSVGAELAFITGTTDLAPSTDFPENDVSQGAAAVRVLWGRSRWGLAFDGTWASGDANNDDGEQTSFRLDRNYHVGLILHRYLQAAWTARGAITAADPDLVGVPSEDLDRLPTRGNATNLLAFFPRAWYRPHETVEIYAGPLFALSSTDFADPFNTRIDGGDPRNALGGDPGRYLGTELDLGVRYRQELAKTTLTIGAEGAALLPGSGLDGPSGSPGTLLAGRFMLSWEL